MLDLLYRIEIWAVIIYILYCRISLESIFFFEPGIPFSWYMAVIVPTRILGISLF